VGQSLSLEALGDYALMAIHQVRIIESGHMSTLRLFELGASFGVCKRLRRWPSLATMNDFLRQGHDDGALATDIEWEPCDLSQEQYEQAVAAFMQGEPFHLDSSAATWESWFGALKTTAAA
jgi:hypothetical protein